MNASQVSRCAITTTFPFALGALMVLAGVQVWAAEAPDPEHGMVLFLKRCAGCHGRHAWGDGLREIPALAGQREVYVIEQLERFATGQRQGSELHGPAMRESLEPADVNRPQALRDLSSYLAQAARNPDPEQGQGKTLPLGKRSYERACIGCHGERGDGSDAQRIPAIGGQHFSYVVARLREFGSERIAHPPTPELTAEERQAIADYVSRLSYLRAQDL